MNLISCAVTFTFDKSKTRPVAECAVKSKFFACNGQNLLCSQEKTVPPLGVACHIPRNTSSEFATSLPLFAQRSRYLLKSVHESGSCRLKEGKSVDCPVRVQLSFRYTNVGRLLSKRLTLTTMTPKWVGTPFDSEKW